jgi:hypothetical protein
LASPRRGSGKSVKAASREAVARLSGSLEGLALVRPLRDKQSCSYLGNVWADGARIVEMLDVLSKTYGKGFSEGAQKLKSPQPHAPRRQSALLSCRLKMPCSSSPNDLQPRASWDYLPLADGLISLESIGLRP